MNGKLLDEENINENINELKKRIERPHIPISEDESFYDCEYNKDLNTISNETMTTGAEIFTYMNFCPPKE